MYGSSKQKIINAALWLCAGAAVGVICTLLYLRGSGTDATPNARSNSTSTAQQASRAERLNELAGAENRAAGAAANRAANNTQRAAELNQRAQAELAGSTELIKQIRADNSRAKRILAELIGNHETGAETDKKN